MSDANCGGGNAGRPAGMLGGLELELPVDLSGFLVEFGSEDACRAHLFRRRWPAGWRCAHCGGDRHYRLVTRPAIECAGCGAQQSLYAGTIFEQTKTPLKTWFLAIHLFLASKGGVSALELKRQLGFGSDQTAWTWLMKLRRAMGVRGEPLDGTVEVEQAVIGAREPGKRSRGADGGTLIVAAVEVRRESIAAPDPARLSGAARQRAEALTVRLARAPEMRRRLGRARLAIFENAAAADATRFVANVVASSAVVVGRGARDEADAQPRQARGTAASDGGAREHRRAGHLLFTLLERLLLGTYHGGVGRHLPAYMDEFMFRFDRKRLAPIGRTLAAIDRAVSTPPFTNQQILGRR